MCKYCAKDDRCYEKVEICWQQYFGKRVFCFSSRFFLCIELELQSYYFTHPRRITPSSSNSKHKCQICSVKRNAMQCNAMPQVQRIIRSSSSLHFLRCQLNAFTSFYSNLVGSISFALFLSLTFALGL